MENREITSTIDVPSNTGVDGFLLALREILKKPRVQEVKVDSRGKITYRRIVINGEEPGAINMEFESVTPSFIIRNGAVEEITFPVGTSAAVVMGRMFDRLAVNQLYPVALVTGTRSIFWEWYRITTNSTLHAPATAFGLPVISDRHVPDTALIMCGAPLRESALIDTTMSLKVEMDAATLNPPSTTVEVL